MFGQMSEEDRSYVVAVNGLIQHSFSLGLWDFSQAILAMTDLDLLFDGMHPYAESFLDRKRLNVDQVVVPACGNPL